MEKDFLNPDTLPDWKEAFSQVVVVPDNSGKTVYVSGQVSVDPGKNLIGENDLSAQAEQAFKNLKSALAAAGGRMSDIVKLNIYVRDYKPADAPLIIAALKNHFTPGSFPAATWLGVQSLAEERFLIEVDAIAAIG